MIRRTLEAGTSSEPPSPRAFRSTGGLEASSTAPQRTIRVAGKRDLVSVKEAAAIFGVTERTVRRWLASGKMPQRVQVGREKKFSMQDIEAEIKLDAFELITLTQASELLGRSRRTILRWIAAGRMPTRIRRGKEQKFRFDDILWLSEKNKARENAAYTPPKSI
jgi:excisionase family DNA binding protein